MDRKSGNIPCSIFQSARSGATGNLSKARDFRGAAWKISRKAYSAVTNGDTDQFLPAMRQNKGAESCSPSMKLPEVQLSEQIRKSILSREATNSCSHFWRTWRRGGGKSSMADWAASTLSGRQTLRWKTDRAGASMLRRIGATNWRRPSSLILRSLVRRYGDAMASSSAVMVGIEESFEEIRWDTTVLRRTRDSRLGAPAKTRRKWFVLRFSAALKFTSSWRSAPQNACVAGIAICEVTMNRRTLGCNRSDNPKLNGEYSPPSSKYTCLATSILMHSSAGRGTANNGLIDGRSSYSMSNSGEGFWIERMLLAKGSRRGVACLFTLASVDRRTSMVQPIARHSRYCNACRYLVTPIRRHNHGVEMPTLRQRRHTSMSGTHPIRVSAPSRPSQLRRSLLL